MSQPSTLVLACACGAENHLAWGLTATCATGKAYVRCWRCFGTIGQVVTQSPWTQPMQAIIAGVMLRPSSPAEAPNGQSY